MNFDNNELKLNTLWNQLTNLKKEISWTKEERKILQARTNKIKEQLFFLYIDRYLTYLECQKTDEELELEYVRVNG